jgi:signal transduction histidine kinase
MDLKRIMRVTAWFLLPIALVGTAAILRSTLVPVLRYSPYITFFPAITICALYGGLGPGLFAIFLSMIVVQDFFISGISTLFDIPGGLPGMMLFLVSSFIILAVCVQLRNAKDRITAEARRLRQSEQTLEAEIAQRKRAEKELRHLTEDLKRSNTDLEQFAYAASHDLQEPLRGIAGFANLLEKHYKGKLDRKADEFINYIIDGTKRMQVLIKDLLEYSRVSAQGTVFRPTNCSVALEQAIYNLRSAIKESGAELTYDLLPTVMGDEAQLSSLFQNLIGNAIKFRNQQQLKIHISAQRKENEWVFSIRDNGIGIDPEQAERIFVIFQRLHAREEYPGTGIGLAICKKVVERYGGKIWVESEPAKGSTFYFTIPVG